MVRIAAVCSNFLAETEDGQVRHSENSLIWQLDPLVATGMEVMFDHLPQSSFKLADVCAQDPTDEKQEVCGFSLARDQPLYSYLETHPVEGRNFAAHMRAQAVQYGDSSVQACYDWSALKGKTLVDVSCRVTASIECLINSNDSVVVPLGLSPQPSFARSRQLNASCKICLRLLTQQSRPPPRTPSFRSIQSVSKHIHLWRSSRYWQMYTSSGWSSTIGRT